jgi:hypothetical protein
MASKLFVPVVSGDLVHDLSVHSIHFPRASTACRATHPMTTGHARVVPRYLGYYPSAR